MNVIINKKGQAVPERVEHISKQDFDRIDGTEVRWLAGGGAMINSRGTVIMIDPVLEGFDMPLARKLNNHLKFLRIIFLLLRIH